MEKLVVIKRSGVHVIDPENIRFFEKSLRKIIVHTKDGDIEYYGRFKELEGKLDDRFMCCHRSYIINMDAIVVMYEGGLYIEGNSSVFFGRDKFRKAKKIFVEYLHRKKLMYSVIVNE